MFDFNKLFLKQFESFRFNSVDNSLDQFMEFFEQNDGGCAFKSTAFFQEDGWRHCESDYRIGASWPSLQNIIFRIRYALHPCDHINIHERLNAEELGFEGGFQGNLVFVWIGNFIQKAELQIPVTIFVINREWAERLEFFVELNGNSPIQSFRGCKSSVEVMLCNSEREISVLGGATSNRNCGRESGLVECISQIRDNSVGSPFQILGRLLNVNCSEEHRLGFFGRGMVYGDDLIGVFCEEGLVGQLEIGDLLVRPAA